MVNDCRVKVFRDGPIEMLDVNSNEPCNAPIPKDHDFGATKRVYKENGCTITEYMHKDGTKKTGMHCS